MPMGKHTDILSPKVKSKQFKDFNDFKKKDTYIISKVWVAKVRVVKVRARTHTCDLRLHTCVCVRNAFRYVCAMCVRADLFWGCDVRSYFCPLFGIN